MAFCNASDCIQSFARTLARIFSQTPQIIVTHLILELAAITRLGVTRHFDSESLLAIEDRLVLSLGLYLNQVDLIPSLTLFLMSYPDSIDQDVDVNKTGWCLLSFDGGGVRGLSSLYIMKGVMQEVNHQRELSGLPAVKPCELFDLIGGTSTGGYAQLFEAYADAQN